MDKVKILEKYLPVTAAPIIGRWIDHFQCEFKVSRNRNTKFGDYRPPHAGKGHRISVNYDLNPYAFLVTTVHEFAHLYTWNLHKHRVKPHGSEWKVNFKRMMQPFFDQQLFPLDIHQAITRYLDNPAASSCADLNLFRTLKKYDLIVEDKLTVEKIPIYKLFKWRDGRVFRREELLRKRYRCTELSTKKIYLFSPMAEVELVAAG